MEMLFAMEYHFEHRSEDQRERRPVPPLSEARLYRWLQRKRCGGRTLFARALDYVTLRAVLFFAAYLFFRARFPARGTALLLAAIFLAICMLVLRVYREISFARFRDQEMGRLRERAFADRLLLLEMPILLPIVSTLCPIGETPVVLQRALPVNADSILALLRTHRGCGRLHVFSCSPFEASATALAARMEALVALHAPTELFCAARKAGITVEPDEFSAFLHACVVPKRTRAARRFHAPDATGARKYALVALLLFGLSFLTDYTLYYRLLSGVCMSIAAAGGAMRRFRPAS